MADVAVVEAVRYLMGLQELVRAPQAPGISTPIAMGGSAPTVVIAASNTNFKTQMKADYVSATADATAELDAAIQDLEVRGGGRILFTEGAFDFTHGFPVNVPITFEGMGRGATVLRGIGGAFDMFTLFAAELPVSFTRLTLDGNKSGVSGSGSGIVSGQATEVRLNLYDVDIMNFRTHGVNLQRTAGISMLTNVYAVGNGHYGIWMEGEGVHFLTSCLAQSNGSIAGAGASTADGFNITGTGVKMVGCMGFQNTGRGLVQGGGLSGGQLLIVGCQFIANGGSGMDIRTTFGGNHAVVGNIAQGNGGHGFEIGDSAGGIVVTGNVAAGNTLSGFRISCMNYGGTLSGNASSANGQHGIHLGAEAISVNGTNRWIVIGNAVSSNSKTTNNTYDGIFMEADSNDNSILCNRVTDIAGGNGQRYAINISAATCDRNAVTGNDCRGGFRTGATGYNDAGTGTINAWAGVFGDNL